LLEIVVYSDGIVNYKDVISMTPKERELLQIVLTEKNEKLKQQHAEQASKR
jgi:hypothetical protein